MKIINNTIWRTDQLRAILQKAAEIELEVPKRRKLRVTVDYTRGGHSSGCAWIGGTSATVRIRHPYSRSWKAKHAPLDTERQRIVLHFASVACHEFCHVRGQDHATMSARVKWHGDWESYVDWAKSLPLEVQVPKAKVKPTADDKLAHVLKMKALAETRVRRAQTILRKWKQKERYYVKAAQKVRQTADSSPCEDQM